MGELRYFSISAMAEHCRGHIGPAFTPSHLALGYLMGHYLGGISPFQRNGFFFSPLLLLCEFGRPLE
jgi:hypothetical protein